MKSTFLSLQTRDFLKSLILFVGAPVLYELQKLLPGYNLPPLVTVGISAAIAYLLKNLFTDDTKTAQRIADENGKKIIDKGARVVPIILALIAFSFAANAQSILKRLPKPHSVRAMVAASVVTDVYAFRALVNVPSYTTDNSLLMGTGVGYGHYKYNPATDKMEAQWSINALAWDKAPLNGKPNAFAYGLAGGLWNNRILGGVATTDFNKFFATIGMGININNN